MYKRQLFGQGGKIGPDLTGSQRSNLTYLLENIVDPSATLAAQFRMTSIERTDGRVLQGVILSKTGATWEIQTPHDRVVVRTEEIAESTASTQSLMPEGLLDSMATDTIRDLFSYLMSPEQVDLPDNSTP